MKMETAKVSFLHKINKQLIFLLISFTVLFLSYGLNLWGVVDKQAFHYFDRPDESMVVGRLDQSAKEGIFSYSGFPGAAHLYPTEDIPENAGNYDKNILLIYDNYLNDQPSSGDYMIYMSQTGGQGIMYSMLQEILPVKNSLKLQIFRGINAMLVALCFTLFIGWIYRNFGFISSFITLLLLLLSVAPTFFGHNLWWALWTYYIPFLTALLALEKRHRNPEKFSEKKVLLLFFISVFVKCIFTGFEYISSTLIAAVCPFIYYSIAERKNLADTIKILFKASVCAVLGVLTEMLVLITQIKFLKGTFMDGVDHILTSYMRRASFVHSKVSYEVDNIILHYLNSEIFPKGGINAAMLIALTIIFCAVVFFITKKGKLVTKNKNLAFIVTTLFSIAGPLSWYIVFKEHSATHKVLDYIVWFIPFLLFAYAMIGNGVQLIISKIKNKN